MAYKIVSQPKAWWPVRFKGVTEDGEVVENVFEMRFIILDEDANIQLERDIREIATSAEAEKKSLSEIGAPIIERIADDWRGVTEDDGTEGGRSLPYISENLKRMLRVPNVLGAIAQAYREARAGEPARRLGN